MRVVCGENHLRCLISALNLENPVSVWITPFVGSLTIQLDMDLSSFSSGICYSFNEPRITYLNDTRSVPDGTYLLVLKEQKDYLILFCLSHLDLIASLASGPSLKLLSGKSREANKDRPALILLKGQNLNEMFSRLFSFSLDQTGQIGKLLKDKNELPTFFEKLGWHSRNFGTALSHQTIIQSVQSILQEGFSLGFVVLEEGWQQLAAQTFGHHALAHFEADHSRFPQGLKGLVLELRALGIEQVGVSHGIMGYQGGIDKRLAQHYDFPPDAKGRYFPGYDLGRTFQFFYDYYAYLKEQGIGFVKVGDQESTSFYCRKGMDVTRLYKHLQTAIQGASSLHFQSAQINADCLRNENLFYWTNSRVASCARANEKNVTVALRHSLTHALWLKHLMHPDFEMWPSEGKASETLAIFHALSGSFNIICDLPGMHNVELLKKCILPSGKILKADAPLTLCADSLFIDPLEHAHIYKAYTLKGENGILALFHLSDEKKTIQGNASACNIPSLRGTEFAVFSMRHGFVGIFEKTDNLSLKLKNGQSDVLTFSPIHNSLALIGCHLFFLTAGPILNCTLTQETLHITSSLACPLLMYCKRQVLEIRRNGQVIPWTLDIKKHLLSIDPRSMIIETPSHYTVVFE